MSEINPEELKGRYITRQDLLDARGWGRLQIEQNLGMPEIINHGIPLYSVAHVLLIESRRSQEELAPNPLEDLFADLIDRFELTVTLPRDFELFNFGGLAGMFLSMGVLGQGSVAADGMTLTEQMHSIFIEKLLFAHTNFSDLRRQLLSSGYEGQVVEGYLKARIKREILKHYPWLAGS